MRELIFAQHLKQHPGFPWWSRDWDSELPLQEAGVQSLIGQLRSLRLHGQENKITKKIRAINKIRKQHPVCLQ